MKRTLFALLLSFGAFAQAPVVESITPNRGPASGGTSVTITGTDLSTPIACLLPCPPQVVFGGIVVDAVEISDQKLTVTTPAHPPEVVDVTIALPGRPTTVVEDGFTFLAGPEDEYELALLPIYFDGTVPGAYGTQWATDLWIHNGGANAVFIADRICPPELVCPPVFPLTLGIDPGRSLHNPRDFFRTTRSNPSLLLYVSKNGAEEVSMSLRVADTSRNALNGGTELPVIRRDELLTRTAQLLNVPLDNRTFRLLLRLYDVTYSEAEFAVRIHPASEEPVQAVYGTTITAKTPRLGSFRGEAAYAELDITHLLHTRLGWPEIARIEVQPLTPGSRYWAVVSLTNNETQLVTLVTPH